MQIVLTEHVVVQEPVATVPSAEKDFSPFAALSEQIDERRRTGRPVGQQFARLRRSWSGRQHSTHLPLKPMRRFSWRA